MFLQIHGRHHILDDATPYSKPCGMANSLTKKTEAIANLKSATLQNSLR